MDTEFQKYLDEALPKVKLNKEPTKFKITIEEHHSGTFEVEAYNIGEAMQIAEDKYRKGEFVIDCDNYPVTQLMMAEDEFGVECTEWEEF